MLKFAENTVGKNVISSTCVERRKRFGSIVLTNQLQIGVAQAEALEDERRCGEDGLGRRNFGCVENWLSRQDYCTKRNYIA